MEYTYSYLKLVVKFFWTKIFMNSPFSIRTFFLFLICGSAPLYAQQRFVDYNYVDHGLEDICGAYFETSNLYEDALERLRILENRAYANDLSNNQQDELLVEIEEHSLRTKFLQYKLRVIGRTPVDTEWTTIASSSAELDFYLGEIEAAISQNIMGPFEIFSGFHVDLSPWDDQLYTVLGIAIGESPNNPVGDARIVFNYRGYNHRNISVNSWNDNFRPKYFQYRLQGPTSTICKVLEESEGTVFRLERDIKNSALPATSLRLNYVFTTIPQASDQSNVDHFAILEPVLSSFFSQNTPTKEEISFFDGRDCPTRTEDFPKREAQMPLLGNLEIQEEKSFLELLDESGINYIGYSELFKTVTVSTEIGDLSSQVYEIRGKIANNLDEIEWPVPREVFNASKVEFVDQKMILSIFVNGEDISTIVLTRPDDWRLQTSGVEAKQLHVIEISVGGNVVFGCEN